MRRSGLDIFLLILKILIIGVLVGYLVLSAVDLVDAFKQDQLHIGESGYIQGFGISFAALLILSFVFDGFALAASVVGLIISLIYKSSGRRKNHIISFIVLSISCVLSVFALVGIAEVIPAILG